LADINQETDSEESSIIWFSQIGKIINKENDEIACVSGKAENVRTRAHLGMAVKLRHPSDRIPDIVSENLQLSRDEMIEAIHSGNVTTIQLLLKRYISIIRSFLSAMSDYDVRFTMDMVESDSRLFTDWYVLSQIERDYYIILEEALRSTNREIIYHVIAFPMDVVYIADEYKDHLVFRRFARFFPDMYTAAARLIQDIIIKELVNDRVWRVLQEYTNFRIISRLEDSDISDKDITTYGGYALEIAFIFNSLLKFSIDLADIKQFEAYGRAFNELMNSINWIEGIPSDRIDDLVFQLHYEKDKTLRKSYEEELSKKKAVAKIEGNFNQTRELIWLGIGGWLAHLVNSNKLSPENYKNFAAVVAQAFPNLETLYKIYSINSSNDKVSRFWTSWRLQELDEEEKGKSFVGGHIEDDSWITRYYCQRGIELSPMSCNSMPKIMPIYSERDIFTEVSKDAETFRTSETWKKTFDFPVDQIGSRINAFVEIHRNISELKKEIEEDEIIHATIDSGLVSEFKLKVMETWEKTQILRSLMIKFGKYEERPDDPTPEDAEAFGFNILEPKAAFIKQNKIHFLGWGEEHGRRLGMSEDARLSEVIIKSLPLAKTNLDRLDDTIYHNLNNLRANGSNPIILYSRVNIRNLNKSKRYKPEWRIDDHEFKDIDGFNGTFDGAAIFSIRELGDQNILMLDFSYFAKLVQYRFEKGSDYPLSITIEPMDETKADKLLTNQPDLLIDKNSGNKIERETAVRNLFQKVHLQILEKSRLEDINPNCGIRIELEK